MKTSKTDRRSLDPASTGVSGDARPSWWRRRWVLLPLGTFLTLLTVVILAFSLSPWPGALLIRHVFDDGASNVRAALEKHTPPGVTLMADQHYRPADDDAFLDVYYPDTTAQTGAALPTVVWIHGGAWISGHRDNASPYLMLIASAGYTVITIDYSVGPEHHYPLPILQINDALTYIQRQADSLHVDVSRMVIAGDSAGAQLASQIATLVTNPAYAAELGVAPAITPAQLRGVVLYCGIYDMDAFRGNDVQDLATDQTFTSRLLRWGTGISLWAYTGARDGDDTSLAQMSTIDHVTAAFPPTFISGGNGDPLTGPQSQALASTLQRLGVPVDTLFFAADHQPNLGHEYQFNLDRADGQDALARMLQFLAVRLSPNT